MSLDISSLKYYGACNNRHIDLKPKDSSGIIKKNDFKERAGKLLSEHNKKTDAILNHFDELHKSGKISDSDYRMAKLEASADDLIYQLGLNALYGD